MISAVHTLSMCFQKLMRFSGIHLTLSRYLTGNMTSGRRSGSLGSRMENGNPFLLYCSPCLLNLVKNRALKRYLFKRLL